MTVGRKYEEFGRTYLFNIDGHHISQWQKIHGKKVEAKYCIDAYHAGNVRPRSVFGSPCADDRPLVYAVSGTANRTARTCR